MTNPDPALKAIAAALFGQADEPEPQPDKRDGNRAPREGSNPEQPRGDVELRQFVADLFGRD